jgi:hypothetical protein
LLQSALNDDQFVEVAEWAQKIEIVDFDVAQPYCGGTTN